MTGVPAPRQPAAKQPSAKQAAAKPVPNPARRAAAPDPAKAPPAGAPRAPDSALHRSRLKPVRPLRLRLIDAVAIAAGALLILKLLGLSQLGGAPGEGLPDFARAVAGARTGYEPPDPSTTGSVGAKEEKAPEKPPEPPQAQPPLPPTPVSPTERALLEKLGARRDALRARSEELDLRERMLNEAERKLETGLGDLRQAEDKVDAAARAREETEKQGLRGIVTMYETMKPKDAARVFDRLGHDVLVPLVLAMNPRKMAEILAVMQPDSAERLTVALANRARGVGGPQAQAGPGLPPGELPAIDPAAGR